MLYLGYFENKEDKVWILSKNLDELIKKKSEMKRIFEIDDRFEHEKGSLKLSDISEKYKLIHSEDKKL